MKKMLVIVLISIGISHSGFSQENAETIKDSINLKEVVVTGSPTKVNLNNIPMAVTVVSRDQIQESSESALLPILNGRVPGLFVTERGITGFGVSTGGAGQISMRGIGGSPTTGVLILIDGHPQFMGIFGHPLSDSYVASDAERVEVIRGPASILYGTNAMGGVINIITRKDSQDGLHGDLRLLYGSENTQKYMLDGGYKKGKFSFFASINHDKTDGSRPHSDFNITDAYLKIGYELNQHIRANTDFNLTSFKASDPGPDTSAFGPSQTITRGYWALTLDHEYEKVSGSVKLFYNFGKHNFTDGFASTDQNKGINLHETFKILPSNSITVGADYTNYGGKATQDFGGGFNMKFVDTTIYESGIYGFVQQTLFDNLTLNAGLRLQYHSVYGKVWIPAGGLAFRLTDQTTWKASIGKGFRSPTIQELFMWNHNPNLNPESVMNYETGILQSFMNNKINLELTGFIVKGNNLIIDVPFKGLENAGEVANKGIEFSANVNFLKNLQLNATYCYINMKNPVYGTPRQNAFISGRYHLNKFHFMLSLQHIDHLDTDPGTFVAYQSYTLLNAKGSLQLWTFAEAFISCQNLLNQKYETMRFYPMPGTTACLGLNFKL